MMALQTTVDSGVDFLLHAAGILAAYIAFSYEKFVLDDEMCGMVRHLQAGFEVGPETLAFDSIATVGSGGNYLLQKHTIQRCRTEFYRPAVCDRAGLFSWVEGGGKDAVGRARARWQNLQMIAAVVGIVVGAAVFGREVQVMSVSVGVSALLVSLLITPIATELPEKVNSVIWIRQRKDTLALGNITGAMVFQSTFPVSIGLIFTTWQLDEVGLVSGLLTLISGVYFYLTLRFRHKLHWWSLLLAGALYGVYMVYVFGFKV